MANAAALCLLMSGADDDRKKDPDFKTYPPIQVIPGTPKLTRQAKLPTDTLAPGLPPKSKVGRGKQTPAVSSILSQNCAQEDTAEVNPSGTPGKFLPVNTLPPISSFSSQSGNMTAEAAYKEMKAAFKEIALSNKMNDLKTAQDLPFFGRAKDPSGKTWVVDTVAELIEYVTKATPDETWNEAGRIKLLRSKMCGLAREYFNTFQGATLAEAKAFLLKMYPDTTN